MHRLERQRQTRRAWNYLVIAVVSLLCGIAINKLYAVLSISITGWLPGTVESEAGILAVASSIILVALIIKARMDKRRKS